MEPMKWQKRIARGELTIDIEKRGFMEPAVANGCTTWQDVVKWYDERFRRNLPGGERPLCPCDDKNFLPRKGETILGGFYRVSDHASQLAKDSPGGTLPFESDAMRGWRCWAGVTATVAQVSSLMSPDTRLFLVDSEIARDVIASRNDVLSGDDIQHSPFPLTWVEFSEPVEFAVCPSGLRIKMAALSTINIPMTDLRLVTIISDFRLKDIPVRATLYMFFASNVCMCVGMEEALQGKTGFSETSPEYNDFFASIGRCVKNIIDFLTSRSFSYVDCRRDHIDLSKIKKFRHVQGALSSLRRDYKLVVMSKDIPRDRPPGQQPDFDPGYSVEIPGCFHRWVYCRSCGDCHRHDLIGSPCRKCGLIVGPTDNIRTERYWHPPYVWGHGPRKDYARHLLP